MMNCTVSRALVLLSVLLLPPTLGLAAQAPRPAAPPDPIQANKDVRAGTQGLDADVGAAMKNLQKLTKDVNKLRDQAKDAKKKADAAKNAADALDLNPFYRKECLTPAERKQLQNFVKNVQGKLDDAQAAKDKADATEKNLRQQVDNTVKGVEDRIGQLQKMADQGLSAAQKAGYKPNSVAVGNLQDAKNALDKAANKLNDQGTPEKNWEDQGGLSKLRDAANQFNPEIRKAKEGLDPSDALKAAKDMLEAAEKILKLPDCPPEGAMVPKPPTEVFVAVDNRPKINVCIAPGQDPKEATAALGLENPQIVASTATDGTMVQTTTDAKTVDKTAQDRGVKLCFASESDFCTIMTPLTSFRGHDHSKHMGPDVHDHHGPDPPFSWGVTPPTPVLRLRGRP